MATAKYGVYNSRYQMLNKIYITINNNKYDELRAFTIPNDYMFHLESTKL